MKEKKVNISSPKIGMNKSSSQYLLESSFYTHMKNGQTSDESGNRLTVSNEHSNILANKFKEGFVVLGFKNDVIKDKTYFFLHNPTTLVSEFGCILNNRSFTLAEDTFSEGCKDCDKINNQLSDPLENKEQIPHQEYLTIFEDSCNNCLNLSINNPVLDIEIKTENVTDRLFFTDGLNEPRYIELNNLEQYLVTGEEICEQDNLEPTCLDCEKLRIFRLFKYPEVVNYTRVLGGSLKKGVYEAAFAYTDDLGNELTSYTKLTNVISIFDENNVVQSGDDSNSDRTSYGIKIELANLDTRFTNYKIVLIETSFGQAQIFKEAGLYNTSDNIILISDNNGQDITRAEVLVPKVSVKSWKGLTASNNILFGYGIKENEIPNLQPVVNLLGGALKWTSTIAKEDLYTKANSNQFKGYNRDEVVPFGIEPISCDGFKYPVYPLVARPSVAGERDIINNKDTQSINSILDDCDDIIREERWQFYNTAVDEGFCDLGEEIQTITQTEAVTTFTEIEVPSVPQGSLIINNNQDLSFFNLKDYIEENQNTCGTAPYTDSPLESICSFLDLSNLKTFNNPPNLEDNCGTPTLISETLEIVQVNNQQQVNTNKDLENYSRVRPSEFCQAIATPVENSDDDLDKNFSKSYFLDSDLDVTLNGSVFKRQNITYADTCNTALDIRFVDTNTINSYSSLPIVHPYFGALLESTASTIEGKFVNLLENKNALYTQEFTVQEIGGLSSSTLNNSAAVYLDKIHKGALWFKVDLRDVSEDFLIEITRLTDPTINTIAKEVRGQFGSQRNTPFKSRYIRVHVFENCNSLDPLQTTSYTDSNNTTINSDLGGIFDIKSTPPLIPISKSIVDNNRQEGFIYLVIDLPLTDWFGLGEDQFFTDDPAPTVLETGVTVPPASCFSINARRLEFSQIDISFDSIDLKKIQKYSSVCNYDVPILNDCEPLPFKKGLFGYTESTEKYPDNKELYDSSVLTIEEADIPDSYKSEFSNYYTSGSDGTTYTLSNETELFCKPIRHFRLPDNIISPFISNNSQISNSDSVIYPLGVTLDTQVVDSFLNIAVKNGLLTQERKDKITGFKIHRGDSTLDRSIKSSGLLFDIKKYTNPTTNEEINYSNFPYNSLGENKLSRRNVVAPTDRNHLFTFHSPEQDYFRTDIPSELNLQGFQFGKSTGVVTQVEEHSKWTILGDGARSLASSLASLEVAAEAVILSSQVVSNAQVFVGLSNSAGVPAFIAAGVVAAFGTISAVVFKYGRFRYQWLEIFRNLGTPENFASYYTSTAKYNYLRTIREPENIVRGLSIRKNIKDAFINIVDPVTGEYIKINNIDREWSSFISTSENFDIEYPLDYVNYDNNDIAPNISSQPLSSELGCQAGQSPETIRNVASPYVALKDYIPNQYGTINSVKWVDTNKYISLDDTSDCNYILGGDTFITRHSIKRKTPLFTSTAFDQADLTPFKYSDYHNFGENTFFLDYEVTDRVSNGGRFFPEINYNIQTDCGNSRSGFYVKPPKKFYLYYYGQPYFLTESRINTNYRTARPEPENQFYPQNPDYINLTQEKTVSIRRNNSFFYNTNYSYQGTAFEPYQLPATYSKEVFDRQVNNPNTVMYSKQDNNENSTSEPWFTFRPLDRYTFPADYGLLQRLKGIESNQVLGTFENISIVFNANDAYIEGITVNNTELGSGGIFARRPKTFFETDLGIAGSQNHALLSCEFGHFIADVKRGQIFKINPNAQGIEEVSRYSNGKPNDMDIWFKEHLPFKILKDFPTFNKIDNPYNGVGLAMGWDSKFRRVFITKKDYKLVNLIDDISYDLSTDTFTKNSADTNLQNLIQDGDLKEIGWTISYKPETGAWESFFDFKPNYFIAHTDYFQTGINQTDDSSEFGIWSHLLTNRSKQVFYGKKYPFVIEYPIKNEYFSKKLETVYLFTEAKRYHNEYDFAINDRITFNKAIIYNDRESSGNLELDVNTGVISLLSKYPITQNDKQKILITQNDNKWSMNYFYNRVKSNRNNIPLFNYDENQIEKEVNQRAVSFVGKKVLERMSGTHFMVRLIQDKTSQYDLELRWGLDKTEQE